MKYYYGNSYAEALGNEPIEINTTKQLRDYQENYHFVIPVSEEGMEEEQFWVLVFKYVNDSREHTERYNDYDDARADFIHMTQGDLGIHGYEYVIWQQVLEDCCGYETIITIDEWDRSEQSPLVNEIPAERARDLLNKCLDWIDMHIHRDDRAAFIKFLQLSSHEKQILDLKEDE